MNLRDIEDFKLSDAVKFHDTLNPALFSDDRLHPDVRKRMLEIAQDFVDHLGIDDIKVKDITLSGSNAAFTYTPHSDVDIHLIVDMDQFNNDEVYRELFNSKKVLYNDAHDIKIHGYDVELYVQDSAEPVKSLGEYSIKNDRWLKYPGKTRANLDQRAAREKFAKLVQLSQLALSSDQYEHVDNLLDTLKRYRKAGLDEHGEFGPENLAYKALRSQGIIQQLYDRRDQIHSRQLSLQENEYEYMPPGAPDEDVERILRKMAQQKAKRKTPGGGRIIYKRPADMTGSSITDAEMVALGFQWDNLYNKCRGTQKQWDRLYQERGIREVKNYPGQKPHQHTEIIRHQVGDWVIYLDNHSSIRAATRGIGPRMMTSILTMVDVIPDLDKRVPVGGDFWIQDTQTNSSFYFKRLNIPSEPLAVRVETGVKDVPRAGSRTPVFRVNAYPGPETPEHIKNMKQLALINRFVGTDVMANRLANVVRKNPMNHPDVITNPETQDSKRYDRAFSQAKKQNKRVKETTDPLDKPTLTPQQIMRKHGVSYDHIIDQLTRGVKVELEHTNDSSVAYHIALAHMAEDPDYYTKLTKVGLEEGAHQTTLNQLYNEIPDRSEMIWNFVGQSDFDTPFTVETINPNKLKLYFLSQYRVEHIDEITDLMDIEQRKIVNRYIKDPQLSDKIIVMADGKVIDGQHRAMAAILANRPIKYIDVAEETLNEGASGYIPSHAERNDPRFKTALTVDIKPDSIKQNAKKLGLGNIKRSGVPPTARSDGKLR